MSKKNDNPEYIHMTFVPMEEREAFVTMQNDKLLRSIDRKQRKLLLNSVCTAAEFCLVTWVLVDMYYEIRGLRKEVEALERSRGVEF